MAVTYQGADAGMRWGDWPIFCWAKGFEDDSGYVFQETLCRVTRGNLDTRAFSLLVSCHRHHSVKVARLQACWWK
ncbi:hypothetical protein LY78DRAFT_45534 [Colletotrichum sublineola]|nr:hypothetical protein LY78DRAFT_45534 [Colletotrichum sublineola]